jgi:hypothetical protein
MDRTNFTTLLVIFIFQTAIYSCVDKTPTNNTPLDTEKLTANQPEVHGELIKPEDVKLTYPLDQQLVAGGKGLYQVKCQACHKLSTERLIGPGWYGITKRRQPDWIMNMITNVDIMLEKDPQAQRLLQECIVRMPNQNLTKDEARKILEFQRANDHE